MHRLLEVLLPFLLLVAGDPSPGARAGVPGPDADDAVRRAFAALHPGFERRPGPIGASCPSLVVPEWPSVP